jgi:hypothetical protein
VLAFITLFHLIVLLLIVVECISPKAIGHLADDVFPQITFFLR